MLASGAELETDEPADLNVLARLGDRLGEHVLHGLLPVSYTHLDVYKRQAEARVSVKTVRRWIDLHGLPSQKLAGLRVVRKRDFLAFLEKERTRRN